MPMKRSRLGSIALACVVLGAGYAGFQIGNWRAESAVTEAQRVTPLPLVLSRIQSMGELRTASYTYQNVFEFETSKRANEAVRWVPGVDSLVQSATRNRALVTVHGDVEAGIDLEQVQCRYRRTPMGQDVLVVSLPRPEVYEPVVRTHVHAARAGVLWADDNLAIKAQSDASRRMVAEGKAQGIEEQASREAEARLRALLKPLVEVPIEFERAGSPFRAGV